MKTKTCTKCHRTLDLSEFYTRKKADGSIYYYAHCKDCKNKTKSGNYHKKIEAQHTGERPKRRTKLRRRKTETPYQFRCRVIKDAWQRAAVRLAEKANQHEVT